MNRDPGILALGVGCFTAAVPTVLLYQAVTLLCVIPFILGLFCVLLGLLALRSNSRIAWHAGWVSVLVMGVAVGLPFGLIAYHGQSGDPITLVVPEGYRGPIRLVIDFRQGINLPLKDGRYTYSIPATGTLIIRDPAPFRRWHSLSASYASGTELLIDHEDRLPAEGVSLHSLGSGVTTRDGVREEYISYYVGTKADLRKYVDSRE